MQPRRDDSQEAVFQFLQDPGTHGISEPVIRIDTHGAVVFLAGPDVFKVKRAVRYAYMDFSTLTLRERACHAEILVNRSDPADLYLGVLPITRDHDGSLHLGGSGQVVEWTVHLKRFDEEATLDRQAARGAVTPALIDALAGSVIAAHEAAPMRDATRATRLLKRQIGQTLDELASEPEIFPRQRTARLASALRRRLDELLPLLARRGVAGQVRRCHGDLHLGNVVVIDGLPILFDALEFDEDLATGDVLYDLAFLVMDLCMHGLVAEANRLLNGYLSLSAEQAPLIDGLAALPLFLSVRAAIRAKVVAASFRFHSDPARRETALAYLSAASEFMMPASPRLIAIGGLSGTGKTRLAAAVAPALGHKPGAIHLRSDVVRKHMAHAGLTTRLPAAEYEAGPSAAVYHSLGQLAERGLCAGQVVIADATYQDPTRRADIAKVAQQAGAAFQGLWLDAPLALRTARIAARRGDASDATEAVAIAQDAANLGGSSWRRLDASQPAGSLLQAALAALQCTGSPTAPPARRR